LRRRVGNDGHGGAAEYCLRARDPGRGFACGRNDGDPLRDGLERTVAWYREHVLALAPSGG
jgi:hypothetical protein